jgi:hypothetical protein
MAKDFRKKFVNAQGETDWSSLVNDRSGNLPPDTNRNQDSDGSIEQAKQMFNTALPLTEAWDMAQMALDASLSSSYSPMPDGMNPGGLNYDESEAPTPNPRRKRIR